MKNKLLTFCITLITVHSFGQQEKVLDTISRTTIIKTNIDGNKVDFTSEKPVLNQIAGAPKAFYTYFWEFGDGNYSAEENPKHQYKNKGNYDVKLWATNNYDTGKPPTTRPKKVAVTKTDSGYKDTASMTEDFTVKRNREPVPNEEMAVVLSYRNYKDYVTNGKIYLFYNEQKYKANNFNILETRTYNNEEVRPMEDSFVYTHTVDDNQSLTASSDGSIITYNLQNLDTINKTNLKGTLEESKTYYKNWQLLEFDNMQPNEERNIFLTMETPPEMLKDTSAIISIRGVYVPDSNYDDHQIKKYGNGNCYFA